MSDEKTLEENFECLQELMDKMAGDISLEEAFEAYSKGMQILKTCNEQIDRVEKKVLVITGNGEQEFE